MKLVPVAAALTAIAMLAACADTGGTAMSNDPIAGAADDTLTDQVDGAPPSAGDIDDSTGSQMN